MQQIKLPQIIINKRAQLVFLEEKMKKNDYFIGECVDQSHDGKGIVKYEGFTYFVNGMITGKLDKLNVLKC